MIQMAILLIALQKITQNIIAEKAISDSVNTTPLASSKQTKLGGQELQFSANANKFKA